MAFSILQRLGIHLVPNHFYGPIPDTRQLSDALWEAPSDLVGIDMHVEKQLALLSRIRAYRDEYNAFPRDPTGIPHAYHYENGKFGAVDGGLYHGILRDLKPKHVVEVGSGYSTMLAASALALNEVEAGEQTELVVIDPFPHAAVSDGFPGLTRLIRRRVQDVALAEFERLDAGDILFIDTSHVLKTGGDVQYEFLEILPRLSPGVIVHVHDIYLPAEYPREWVIDGLTFWSEQYILQAFLAFNSDFEVMLGGQYLHLEHADKLAETFELYKGEPWIGSFWLERTRLS